MKLTYFSGLLILALGFQSAEAGAQTKKMMGTKKAAAPVTRPRVAPGSPDGALMGGVKPMRADEMTANPPKAGPAKNGNKEMMSKSMTKEFDINGVRVIMRPATNDVVSAVLFVSGGVQNYTQDQQGIENIALSVLTDGGSKKFPKEEFHKLTERKGISIGASTTFDYSVLTLKSTLGNFNTAWDLFSDMIVHPDWNAASLDQVKGQTISGLQQQQSDPDATLADMTREGIYKGERYAINPDGTPESVTGITMDAIQKHYNNILKRKKLVLVIVGKVTEADVRAKAAAFASLPEGTSDQFRSVPPKIVANIVDVQEREIATNYMRATFQAPPKGSKDDIAMRLGMAILSDRLFVEVRTKRNLSYAPSASLSNVYDPYSFMYVSTTNPNDAAKVMLDELKKARAEGFSEKELMNQKEGFLTSYYMGQETNDGQALSLGSAELSLGYRRAEMIMDLVKAVKLEDVNSAFKKYATHVHWFYLGDKSKIDEKIFKDF